MNIRSQSLTIWTVSAQIAFGSALGLYLGVFSPASAEYQGGMETSSLRTPLIPGAASFPPYVVPDEGQPPPIGDGAIPAPVTPGHLGGPCPPPSAVPLPPMGALDKPLINQMVAPYLTPPPSTPGDDPGMLHGPNGFQPPASVVDINSQGGISGEAPIKRWGGQTTRDLGMSRFTGSQTTDFGQDIDQLESIKQRGVRRLISEDGPRQTTYPGRMGNESTRQASLPGAQATQNLHGNRELFKGANLRSRMTIAPY